MRFSLILATLNRSREIKECLISLEEQKFKDFEVIVIDQSEDELTKMVVSEFSRLEIKYFKVEFKGLSKARNFGIKYAEGEYCCLLDDDAVYSEHYLDEANKIICNHDNAVLSGVILSIEDHKTPFVKYKDVGNGSNLNISGILNTCPSAALIFPKEGFDKCGGFDERLGVGNEFASGEETDFLLRLYDEGYQVYFCEKMIAFHPIKPVTAMQPVYKHYLGKGALFKIDFCERKKIRLLSLFLKSTFGMWVKAYLLDKKNKDLYLTRERGFVEGIKNFKIEVTR